MTKIRWVSNKGRLKCHKGIIHKGSVGTDGRPVLTVGGVKHQLAVYVHVLFNDPTMEHWEKGDSVDHIDRDVTNNNASNLRWASKQKQASNRNNPRPKTTVSQEPFAFPNEKWARISDDAFVSNMGRIKRCKCRGNNRGDHPYTPLPREDGYCFFKMKPMGRVVLEAFGFAAPTSAHTVDHIDKDPFNNRLCNLRWATPTTQLENRRLFYRCEQYPVEGRVNDFGPWIWYAGVRSASEKTGCTVASIRSCLSKKCTRKYCPGIGGSWVFRPFVDEIEGEEWAELIPWEWGRNFCIS